jgi:hypothetical protein
MCVKPQLVVIDHIARMAEFSPRERGENSASLCVAGHHQPITKSVPIDTAGNWP